MKLKKAFSTSSVKSCKAGRVSPKAGRLFHGVIHSLSREIQRSWTISLGSFFILFVLFGGTAQAGFFDWVGSFFHTSGKLNTASDGLVGHWLLDEDYEALGTELVTNGTMESDSSWANTTSAPASNIRSVGQVHNGTYSRRFIPDAVDEGIQSNTFTTTTGKSYRLHAWVYPDDGTTVTVTIRKGDNSGDVYDSSQTGLTQDAWNEVTFDYTETAGGAGAYIIFDSGASSSGTWYIDNVSIKEIQVFDLSGNRNDGSLYQDSTIYTTDRFGMSNEAMEFNGTDDHVFIADNDVLDGYATMTISAWVRPTGTTAYSTVFMKGETPNTVLTNDNSYYLGYDGVGGVKSRVAFGTGVAITQVDSTSDLPLNTWSFLTGTYDGSTVRLYVNGVEENSNSLSGSVYNSAADLTIGERSTSYYPWTGDIQDVRVYNRAFSPWEVKKLYEQTTPEGVTTLKDGLISRWTLSELEEVSSSITGDTTDNANDGTLYNSPSYGVNHNGVSNGAIDLEVNSSQFIRCGETVSEFILGTSDHTYTAWIKPESFGNGSYRYIIAIGHSSTGNQSGFGIYDIGSEARLFNSAYSSPLIFSSVSAGKMPVGSWSHVAMVHEGANSNFYVNGEFQDSLAITLHPTVGMCRLGSHTGETSFFDGILEDVRIYNRALSPVEIRRLYLEDSVTKNFSLSDGLVGRWTLADRDGVTTGSDLLDGWDFTDGWTASTATIDNSTQFSITSSGGYIYKSLTTAGKRYRMHIAGSLGDGLTSFSIKNNTDTISYSGTLTGTFDTSFDFTSTGNNVLFKGGGSGQMTITEMTLYEVQATDVTGNEYHGTITGAVTVADHNGVEESAMTFDGIDDGIVIPQDLDTLLSTDDFSVSTWVKLPASVDSLEGILGNYVDNYSDGFWFYVSSDNKIRARIKDTEAIEYVEEASVSYTDNLWHHVVFTADRSANGKLFIDGVYDGAVDISDHAGLLGSQNFYIGKGASTQFYFNGSISDVRIYNRVLSPWEIYKLYNES